MAQKIEYFQNYGRDDEVQNPLKKSVEISNTSWRKLSFTVEKLPQNYFTAKIRLTTFTNWYANQSFIKN